ncbi:MAG: DUF2794 domain-containing protein [Pseudomonadota bacterium]
MKPIDPSGLSTFGVVANQEAARPNEPQLVTFHRRELTLILNVYGRMLSLGIARDYAIDHLKDRAVFSIFRRTSETPLYCVEKKPRDALRQGAYSVSSPTGGILKRGRDLSQVMKVFDKKLIRAVE